MGVNNYLGKEIRYSIEIVNKRWIRVYLLLLEKHEFLGANNPLYFYNNVIKFLHDWPTENRCIFVFSETHYCLYGRSITNREADIFIQDRNAIEIIRNKFSKDQIIEYLEEYRIFIINSMGVDLSKRNGDCSNIVRK
jgi:hypothetical protein